MVGKLISVVDSPICATLKPSKQRLSARYESLRHAKSPGTKTKDFIASVQGDYGHPVLLDMRSLALSDHEYNAYTLVNRFVVVKDNTSPKGPTFAKHIFPVSPAEVDEQFIDEEDVLTWPQQFAFSLSSTRPENPVFF